MYSIVRDKLFITCLKYVAFKISLKLMFLCKKNAFYTFISRNTKEIIMMVSFGSFVDLNIGSCSNGLCTSSLYLSRPNGVCECGHL